MDLAAKLQLKPAASLALVDAPAGLASAIGSSHAAAPVETADAILVCVRDASALEAALDLLAARIARDALVWVAYPKAGQLGTDLNRDVIRETVEPHGAQPVRQIALDEVWSALRLRPR